MRAAMLLSVADGTSVSGSGCTWAPGDVVAIASANTMDAVYMRSGLDREDLMAIGWDRVRYGPDDSVVLHQVAINIGSAPDRAYSTQHGIQSS